MVVPPFVCLALTSLIDSPSQVSVLTSKQMAALPSLLSIRRAKIKLNGHPSPPHSERGVRVRPVLQAFVERKKGQGLCTREKGADTCTKWSGPLCSLLGAKKLAGD